MYEVNGSEYGLNHLTGEEILTNAKGCDSIIYVELTVLENSYTLIEPMICRNDNEGISINGTAYGLNNLSDTQILVNHEGCDSIIDINVQIIELDTAIYNLHICSEDDFIQFKGNEYTYGDIDTFHTLNQEFCDSVFVINISEDRFIQPLVDTIFYLESSEDLILDTGLSSDFLINWYPDINLSCGDCINPTLINVFDWINDGYEILVTDKNGCQQWFDIFILESADPYIPNIFSPNGDGHNDFFQLFFSPKVLDKGVELLEFRIYERWSDLLEFQSDIHLEQDHILWDGLFKNKKALPGVYIYDLTLDYGTNEIKRYQGTITLIN